MEQQGIVREILRIADPVVRSLGLVIWGIELIPSGRTLLRIYVDTPLGAPDAPVGEADADESAREAGGRGPSIDQCAKISRHVGLALEAEDIIPRAYVLELSSPGLERPFFALAQLAPYLGSDLELKLGGAQSELPDRKRLRGKLEAVGEHAFTLLVYDAPEGTRLVIRWDNVRKATLAPEIPFANPEKPGKKKPASKAGATSK
jgi:ribosome maturation factor RimP